MAAAPGLEGAADASAGSIMQGAHALLLLALLVLQVGGKEGNGRMISGHSGRATDGYEMEPAKHLEILEALQGSLAGVVELLTSVPETTWRK